MVDVNDLRDDITAGLDYWEELLEHDKDNICDDCKPIKDRLRLEHFGTPCWLEQDICEPGEDHCKKVSEYEEICRLLDEVREAREKIINKKIKKVA